MKLTDKDGNEYELIGKAQNHEYSGYYIVNPLMPKPKKIDMSVCIKSKVDCEFFHDSNSRYYIDTLVEIITKETKKLIYHSTNGRFLNCCRPRFSTPEKPYYHASPKGWDKCPIPIGLKFSYWDINNTEFKNSGKNHLLIDWSTVLMFEVTGYAQGYECTS